MEPGGTHFEKRFSELQRGLKTIFRKELVGDVTVDLLSREKAIWKWNRKKNTDK